MQRELEMSIEGSFCDNDSHNGLVTSSPKTGAEMVSNCFLPVSWLPVVPFF